MQRSALSRMALQSTVSRKASVLKTVVSGIRGPASAAGDAVEKARAAAARQFKSRFSDFSFSLKATIAEFFAMTLFVYLGCGSAVMYSSTYSVGGYKPFGQATGSYGYQDPAVDKFLTPLQTAGSWGIIVALAFGLGIAVVVYCIAHISGGQVNPIVSTALFITGRMGPVQAAANIIAQYVGSILGAAFLYGTVFQASTTTLGANAVSPTFSEGQALLGETVMSSLLVFTVLQTACEPRAVAKNVAPLAIGLSVFLAHCVLLPIDGCSINPARSFGPAAVAGFFRNFWVFNAGPWLGCLAGCILHWVMWFDWPEPLGNLGKKNHTNIISNDNSGLSDAALRIGG